IDADSEIIARRVLSHRRLSSYEATHTTGGSMQPHATISRRTAVFLGVAVAVILGPHAAAAQWPDHPSARIPRTAAGKPELSAPVARTPDGKPDLSGIWQSESDPTGVVGGIEGI